MKLYLVQEAGVANNPGSETARIALQTAQNADAKADQNAKDIAIVSTKVDGHEAECGRRWGVAMRMFFIAIVGLFGIFGTLLYDKFMQ